MERICIPSGTYKRGSYLSKDEMPVQFVSISSFYITKYPVTNKQFVSFMQNGGYSNKSLWCADGWSFINFSEITSPSYFFSTRWNKPNQPITGISWYEANAYAKFVGGRLPTESEWEYAAKGNTENVYPWGNEEPIANIHANFAPECEPSELQRSSTEVQMFEKYCSPFGVVDMSGNLAEWCSDNYHPNFLWDTVRKNPRCTKENSILYVTKGGSGLHDQFFMRCASRDPYKAPVRDNIVGMRVAFDA